MASKAELRRRLEDLTEFHRLVGEVLALSVMSQSGWDGVRVTPKQGRESEWLRAKSQVDRHAARAARAFSESGIHVMWKPPGTWNQYPINPGSQWGTILEESPRFSVEVLDACTNQAIGALDARIDDPIRGERSKVGPGAHWLARF